MSKGNRLFKDFVTEQKQLNEFEIRELDTTIDQILENPEKFGQDFVENNLSRSFKRILEAKKLGMDFAKKNLQIK
jgi:hypothetical protein